MFNHEPAFRKYVVPVTALLAQAVVRGQLTFSNALPLEQTIRALRTICGVSETTPQWIAMRAFGEPDVFPPQEARRKNLLQRTDTSARISALDRAEMWRPWRAYASVHLTTQSVPADAVWETASLAAASL